MKNKTWTKFTLNLWKNIIVHWNHRHIVSFSLLAPTLFCAMLAMLRHDITVKTVPILDKIPVSLETAWSTLIAEVEQRQDYMKNQIGRPVHNVFIPRKIVAYAPAQYEAFTNIMELAHGDNLPGTELRVFNSCANLRETMQVEFYLVGVCFDDSVMNVETESVHNVGIYPNHLTFSLVFPSEFRIYNHTHIAAHWNTEKLFTIKNRNDYLNPDRPDNGFVNYVNEGFSTIQFAVSEAYVRLISNKSQSELPKIDLIHFPVPSRIYDKLNENLEIVLSFFIIVSYITPVSYFLKYILIEKEKNTMLLMNLLHVRHSLQFFAWLVPSFCGLFGACIPAIILLKIHWNAGYAVLTNTSSFIILQVFLSYNMSILCFSYTLANFFQRATTGVCVTALAVFITYLPFIITIGNRYEEPTVFSWMACLFPTSVLGMCFQAVLDYEINNQVLEWGNLFSTTNAEPSLTIGGCILTSYGLAILYGGIGLIIPEINLRASIFPEQMKGFMRDICSGQDKRTNSRHSMLFKSSSRTRIFEVEPSDKHIVVEFNNVCKEINGELLLDDISFNLFQDECTVLMGHNGSGKTLLMSIAVGLTEPTSGSVFINKAKVQDNTSSGHRSFGVCMSDRLLYDGLTVTNQLTFFCRLRGLTTKETKAEVKKFLKAMQLEDKRDVLTQNLTTGLRHHLALCTALVGGTKIVMLDEPSVYTDISLRKLMWKLLYSEKKGRTIFMITHCFIEAEVIADRVLIISKGTLQCWGSTYFLRTLYGQGYRLVLYKGPTCDADTVTQLFRKYIRNISPISDFCSELSYMIYEKYDDVVVPLLTELNKCLKDLDITTFSLSEITVEDIFYNVGAERASHGNPTKLKLLLNGTTPHSEEDSNILFVKPKLTSKYQLWLRQWQAMLYKYYIFTKFNKTDIITCLVSAVIFVLASLCVFTKYQLNLPSMRYGLTQYKETVTIVDSRPNKSDLVREVSEMYLQDMFGKIGSHKILETVPPSFQEYIREKMHNDIFAMRLKYVMAVTFSENYIIAWFNNLILHTAPLSLNTVFNALLRTLLDSNAKIVVKLDPLPFSSTLSVDRHMVVSESHLTLGNYFAPNICGCFCYMGALAFAYLVEEKQARFKLLQILSGLRLSTFWLSTFFNCFIKLFFVAVLIVLSIWLPYNEVFYLPHIIGICFLVLITGGIAVISINYALGFFFNDTMNAYILITTYHIFGCLGAIVLDGLYVTDFNEYQELNTRWHLLLRICPLYSFCRAFLKVFAISTANSACRNDVIRLISIELENCTAVPNCCGNDNSLLMDEDILPNLLVLFCLSLIGWIIIFFNEGFCSWHWNRIPRDNESSALEDYQKDHSLLPVPTDNSDTIYERTKVNSLSPRERWYTTVICENVGTVYNNEPVLKRISFYLEPADCFGVVGPNGAGKSTLLRLIVGDEQLSYGRLYIKNVNMSSKYQRDFKYISYGQSRLSLNQNFTICETFKFFLMLQGFERRKLSVMSESLARLLGLLRYYHKRLRYCSRGIIVRTQHAIAIITKPAVLCLDMPTAYLDLAATRQLWNVLNKLRQRNRTTIIFSSLIPRACEMHSTKMAIMQKGRFSSIGTPAAVGQKHQMGCCVYVKLLRTPESAAHRFFIFTTFMERHFPTAILRVYYCDTVMYFVPEGRFNMAQILETIKPRMIELKVETYFITRETLGLIYMDSLENEMLAISEELDEY